MKTYFDIIREKTDLDPVEIMYGMCPVDCFFLTLETRQTMIDKCSETPCENCWKNEYKGEKLR